MFPVEVILDVMYQFFMASNKRFHCRVYQGVYRHMNIMFVFYLSALSFEMARGI